MFMEKPPGVGQLQRSAAIEQQHPELVFQLLDLPAERGLGDVKHFRRAREIPLARYGAEVPQLSQIHRPSRFLLPYSTGIVQRTNGVSRRDTL
jgi:hypothetical protein